MLRKLFYLFGVSHILIAVGCMLIGVIVEFHQVHVYKNNISFWELQAAKTVKDDTKKFVPSASKIVKKLLNNGFTAPSYSSGDLVHYNLSENTIYSRHLFDLTTHEYRIENILRGPPVV